MASRDGATVDGTDGSDFAHRERVVSQPTEIEAIEELAEVEELPLAGDYSGIGGPDSVPLESDGAFEKPTSLGNAYSFLTELFMAPSDESIIKFQVTEKKRLM